MAQPTFTLTAGDGLASRIGTTREELEGTRITLESNVKLGGLVTIDDGIELLDRVIVYLDSDGKINGDTGITLTANSEALNLSEPLEWQVSFKGVRSQGFARAITPFSFHAPEAGGAINLAAVIPPPGQTSRRGPAAYRIVSGAFDESDNLILTNQDNSTFSIAPADGVLFFVDNGDGTVSVG